MTRVDCFLTDRLSREPALGIVDHSMDRRRFVAASLRAATAFSLAPLFAQAEERKQDLPDPQAPIVDILHGLKTPEDVSTFLQTHGKWVAVKDATEYQDTFREPLEDFQKRNWRGVCNNFAEFACQWGHHHKFPMYLAGMLPKDLSQIQKKEWHLCAMLCIEDGKHIVVFDNREIVHWRGTMHAYTEKYHPELALPPYGGITRWAPAEKDNFFYKLGQQIKANETCVETCNPYHPGKPPAITSEK